MGTKKHDNVAPTDTKEVVADYGAYQSSPDKAGDNTMAVLSGLARQQLDAERKVAEIEEELAKAKKVLADVAERDLPAAMDELKLESFVTSDGLKIQVKEKVHVNVSEERRPKVVEWLDDHNQSGMVKRSFIISFGKSEEAWARKFARDLEKRKKRLNVKSEDKVEASTLKAFVRKELAAGHDLPLELFGVHRRRVSEVALPGSKGNK